MQAFSALPILRGSNSGSAVSLLQDVLESKVPGWNMVGHDGAGVFGSSTTQAVMDFQRRNGLTVDGIVGPNTWRALGFDPQSYLADEVVVTGELPTGTAAASFPWLAVVGVGVGLLFFLSRKR